MIQEDYFIKLIKDCIKFFAKLIFNNSIEEIEEQLSESEMDDLSRYLNLFDAGKVDEVKILVKNLAKNNQFDTAKVGILFFLKINEYSNQELLDKNYSRNMLEKDISDFMNSYGYGDIVNIYFGNLK
ncbi:DUF6483 family protein [Anaerorhabdus sp.]|uniref:DUF6483 family protein n=2 Tax=Anaerorhabdus sp. TaxID=1872524 RepID=UPI002FC87D7F